MPGGIELLCFCIMRGLPATNAANCLLGSYNEHISVLYIHCTPQDRDALYSPARYNQYK
jgi:hypothetical protein